MRFLLVGLVVAACSARAPARSFGAAGTQAAFDLDARVEADGFFYELPWPSDLRLTASGAPDVRGFPNRRALPFLETFRALAMQRRGFAQVPVAYFRFDAPLAPRAAEPVQSAFLVDLTSGARLPVWAATPARDVFVPDNLLALAPRPGFVLSPHTKYAFVVLRSYGDAAGRPLGVPAALDQLRRGLVPDGALGAAARDLYAPLWPLVPEEVAAATVFTTGDVVAETFALTEAVRARQHVALSGVSFDHANERACVLRASVSYPQFQHGTPPFDSGGLFSFDASGVPEVQRDESAGVTLSIPRQPMPPAGYPVVQFFHGSGGTSLDVMNMGPTRVAGGSPTPDLGPGWVLAGKGIAAFGAALPLSPERLRGASDTAYLNLQNPAAMRDTFRQGIIEQRLLLDALLALRIDPALLAPCMSVSSEVFFDAGRVAGQGQSMGGMYTNLISAVEPRIRASVPTGAGGFWTYFILITHLHEGLPDLLALLLDARPPLTFLHPALQLVELAWEPADPFVSMSRLGANPLPHHPVRPVYEPVGKDDIYFPTALYDAIALSYGHQQAGLVVWPSMQEALKARGLDGVLAYPVAQNRRAADGSPYTGVVVQYAGDGIDDPHYIYRQLDSVKHQYGCFLRSFFDTGVARVVAPAAETAPCPP